MKRVVDEVSGWSSFERWKKGSRSKKNWSEVLK